MIQVMILFIGYIVYSTCIFLRFQCFGEGWSSSSEELRNYTVNLYIVACIHAEVPRITVVCI